MENQTFINNSLDSYLNLYIKLKKDQNYSTSNNFILYVIYTLIYIYGEDNIVDLYEKKDSISFTYLLNKYNVDSYYVNKLYKDVDNYIKYNQDVDNPYFYFIEEDLIELFIAKAKYLDYDEKKMLKFKDMLFTLDNKDKYILEYLVKYVKDKTYVVDYFNNKIKGIIRKLDFSLKRDNVLSDEVYEAFNLTKEKRDKLSYKELEYLNNKIYKYFDVSPIDIDVNKKILTELKNKNKKINLMLKPYIFVIIVLLIIIIIVFIILKMRGVF